MCEHRCDRALAAARHSHHHDDGGIVNTTEAVLFRAEGKSLVEPISPGAVKLVFVQPEVAWYRSCRRYWTRKTCVTQIEWRLKKAKGRLSRRAPVWCCETGARRGNGDIFSQPSSGFRTIQGRVQRPAAHPDACLTKV